MTNSAAPRSAPSQPWQEIFQGGSEPAEQRVFADLALRMVSLQRANQQAAGSAIPHRTLHAKIVVGVNNAELAFADTLPSDLQIGDFIAGARLPATVRLSNANGALRSDTVPDVRGAAVKLELPNGVEHDLLATSYPVSHARNATQFVEIAEIGAGPADHVAAAMLAAFGPAETERIADNLKRATRPSDSLALESYWSRGAVLWGAAGPVRFRFSPLQAGPPVPVPADDPDRLRLEFAARLQQAPCRFALHVQRFVNEELTPIEDGAVEWREQDAPWVQVATLTIPEQDILGPDGQAAREHVDALAFNPWHAPTQFRPLGNLNRARRAVYTASAQAWQA